MKIIWAVLIIVLIAALICWVRTGADVFSIVEALPLLGGHEPSWLWDALGGGGLLLITAWGIRRLQRKQGE